MNMFVHVYVRMGCEDGNADSLTHALSLSLCVCVCSLCMHARLSLGRSHCYRVGCTHAGSLFIITTFLTVPKLRRVFALQLVFFMAICELVNAFGVMIGTCA